MKLTSTDRQLALLQHALEQVLVPELHSSNARATAGIMQALLQELRKRETRTPDLLARHIVDGHRLVGEMQVLLAAAEAAAMPPPPTTLAAALAGHAVLTTWLADLCEKLARLREQTADADRHALISALLLRAARWELDYYIVQREPLAELGATAVAPAPLTAESLSAFVQRCHPDGNTVRITDFESIPGGFGKQTSSFMLHDAAGRTQALIARKSDPHPMLSHGGFIIEKEFHLLKAVAATGYPAPTPLWLGSGVDGVDASFYVMERLPGRIPGSFLGGLGDGDASAMLLDVASQLGRLHALGLAPFAGYIAAHDAVTLLQETVEACYRRQIAEWSRYAAETEQLTSPFLQYLIDWLQRNVPADARPPVLLHGDFNIHNLLVDAERVSGVLDWECAMFGAPEQDLAYIQPHISQHIGWDRFIEQYLASGGRTLDTASMPFYLAFSALRLHIAMLRATRNLQSGANDDIRYAMVELAFGARFMELGLASAGG